jgi:hypothetical protein
MWGSMLLIILVHYWLPFLDTMEVSITCDWYDVSVFVCWIFLKKINLIYFKLFLDYFHILILKIIILIYF